MPDLTRERTLTREQIAELCTALLARDSWQSEYSNGPEESRLHAYRMLDQFADEWRRLLLQYGPFLLSMAEECLRLREQVANFKRWRDIDSANNDRLGGEIAKLRAAVEPMRPAMQLWSESAFGDDYKLVAWRGQQMEPAITVGMLRALLAAMEPEAKP